MLDTDGRQCLDAVDAQVTVHPSEDSGDRSWFAVGFCRRHVDQDRRNTDYQRAMEDRQP